MHAIFGAAAQTSSSSKRTLHHIAVLAAHGPLGAIACREPVRRAVGRVGAHARPGQSARLQHDASSLSSPALFSSSRLVASVNESADRVGGESVYVGIVCECVSVGGVIREKGGAGEGAQRRKRERELTPSLNHRLKHTSNDHLAVLNPDLTYTATSPP